MHHLAPVAAADHPQDPQRMAQVVQVKPEVQLLLAGGMEVTVGMGRSEPTVKMGPPLVVVAAVQKEPSQERWWVVAGPTAAWYLPTHRAVDLQSPFPQVQPPSAADPTRY